MSTDLLQTLAEHRVSFMGRPQNTRFGFGRSRNPIVLEPFIQFRGGWMDILNIGAFTYLGCVQSQYRHVQSIGRFCSLGPNMVAGAAEHATSMVSSHSMFTGNWNATWPELFTEFGISQEEMTKGAAALRRNIGAKNHRIVIGNDVWIGDGVFIARGVKIGDGAIVAARAVITKDVEPYSIVGGVPARRIRYRFDESTIARLNKVKWWEYGPAILVGTDWGNPEKCLDAIERKISDGFTKYRPNQLRILADDTTEFVHKSELGGTTAE